MFKIMGRFKNLIDLKVFKLVLDSNMWNHCEQKISMNQSNSYISIHISRIVCVYIYIYI